MMTLYALADIAGRFLSTLLSHRKPAANLSLILVGLSLLRTVQIYTSLKIGFSEAYDSDFLKILNTVVLGMGNGFLGTMLMIMGPYKVSSAEAERAG